MIRPLVFLSIVIALFGCSSPRAHLATGTERVATGVHLEFIAMGRPTDPPMLLLHGYGDSWFSFDLVMKELAASHRVYAISQRGFGDSDRPSSGYSMPDFAADALAFLDSRGIDRAIVVGHSMGSLIAIEMALAAPERIAGLVLVGTAAHVRSQGVVEFSKTVDDLRDPIAEEFVREFQESTVHVAPPAAFMERIIEESLKPPARVWQAALKGLLEANYTNDLSRIAAPTLVIQGELDTIFDPTAKAAPSTRIPHAVLHTYEETGHAPHWERPRRFTDDVLTYARGLPREQRR